MTTSAASADEWRLDPDTYKAALESLKAEGLDPGRKIQNDINSREMITKALTEIKPSPDKAIRIQQLKEFISKYLLAVDENLSEEILLMNVKKPFDLTLDEFRLIKNFYKGEYKKEQERQRKNEWESREFAPISFGKTANASARAMAILAREFKDNHAPVLNIGGDLYIYTGRIFETTDSALAELRNFLYEQTKLHGIEISPTNVNNVLKRIVDENTIDTADLVKSPERIVVENGILDVLTGEIFDHTPTEKHLAELEIIYDPNIKISDVFDNYLKSTFNGVEWEIDLLQELFGYCLLKSYKLEAFFFLVGNGGNGRTVTTNLLTKFLAEKNVSSKKLQEICNPHDVFSLMGLHGKLANICGETGVEGINDLSNLKAATGRDRIEARLPYKQWVKFYNYAKMIFSMNQVPTINDSTRGRTRRMKIIDYPNSFVRGKNADENLEDKLMQPGSLTGILNWAIEGLQRLIKEGKFTDPRSEAEIAIEFEKKSSPVKYFVHEHVDDATAEYWADQTQANAAFYHSKVTFGQLLETYVAYAKLHNLPTLNPKYIVATVKYECERVGFMVKQCRDRYTIDSATGKSAPREDYLKGIVLCGRHELGLPEIKKPITLKAEEKMEVTKPTKTEQTNIDAAVAGGIA